MRWFDLSMIVFFLLFFTFLWLDREAIVIADGRKALRSYDLRTHVEKRL